MHNTGLKGLFPEKGWFQVLTVGFGNEHTLNINTHSKGLTGLEKKLHMKRAFEERECIRTMGHNALFGTVEARSC